MGYGVGYILQTHQFLVWEWVSQEWALLAWKSVSEEVCFSSLELEVAPHQDLQPVE